MPLSCSWNDIVKLAKKHTMDPDRLEYLQTCRCEFCLEELKACGIALLALAAPRATPTEEDEAPEPVPAAAFEKTKKAKAKHTTKPDRRRDEVIRERRRMGDRVAAIAKDYGISEERVRQIARGVKVEEPIEEEVAQ